MTILQQNILKLRNEGKSYNEISKELGCSKGTVSYIVNPVQMEKAKQRCKRHLTKKGALYKKMQGFCYNYGKKPRNRPNSSLLDINKVLKRIGENPRCYLTGKSIDISDMSSYSLDHIKPLSRGGKSTIKNLGLATSQANQCKSDLTLEELVVLCKEILVQQGFDIIKK